MVEGLDPSKNWFLYRGDLDCIERHKEERERERVKLFLHGRRGVALAWR